MIIRTSNPGEAPYTLTETRMKEEAPFRPYFLMRADLQKALANEYADYVIYYVGDTPFADYGVQMRYGLLRRGSNANGEEFLQIGCKCFEGINREHLVQWAKSYTGGK